MSGSFLDVTCARNKLKNDRKTTTESPLEIPRSSRLERHSSMPLPQPLASREFPTPCGSLAPNQLLFSSGYVRFESLNPSFLITRGVMFIGPFVRLRNIGYRAPRCPISSWFLNNASSARWRTYQGNCMLLNPWHAEMIPVLFRSGLLFSLNLPDGFVNATFGSLNLTLTHYLLPLVAFPPHDMVAALLQEPIWATSKHF